MRRGEAKHRILIMGFGGVLVSGKMLYNKLSSLYSFEGRQMVLRMKSRRYAFHSVDGRNSVRKFTNEINPSFLPPNGSSGS